MILSGHLKKNRFPPPELGTTQHCLKESKILKLKKSVLQRSTFAASASDDQRPNFWEEWRNERLRWISHQTWERSSFSPDQFSPKGISWFSQSFSRQNNRLFSIVSSDLLKRFLPGPRFSPLKILRPISLSKKNLITNLSFTLELFNTTLHLF